MSLPAVHRTPAHDEPVQVVLDQRVRWLSQNQDVTGHTLGEQVHRMWRDWRPVVDGARAFILDGHWGHAWVFSHHAHGWAITYAPDAERLWKANQQRAVLMAHQFSASAPTLMGLCDRLIHAGAGASRPLAVEWLLTCDEVDPSADREPLRMLLALRAPVSDLSGRAPRRI